jgi:xylan 1,4-beta-xylosidase
MNFLKQLFRQKRVISLFMLIPLLLSLDMPVFAWQSDNGDGTFTNPVLNADYPDIAAIRVGNDFYMVSSTFVSFPSIPIMHSKDLINWEIIGYVTADLNGTGKSYMLTNTFEDYGHGCWAPTIAYRNGTYYIGIYQAQGRFIMCTATNPAGPYTKTVYNQGFHDPGLFIDDDGTGYIISEANDVKVSKLSADYKSVVSSMVTTRIEGVTGRYLVEGTHVIKKNGYYYIFRNSTPPESYTYCLRSKSIYGPYDMRILLKGPSIPGGAQIHQGGPIDTPTGEWWFYVFQDGNGLGRRDILIPMQWQDNWPILGDPATVKNVMIGGKSYPMGSVPVTYKKPNVGGTYPIKNIPNSDEFNSANLGVQWQWNHYPDTAKWSLSEHSGYLRLRAKNANNLWRATNTLTQRVEGPDCEGTIELDTTNMKDGDNAGLCLLNIPYGSIGIVQSGGVKKIIVNINAKEDAQGTISYGPNLSGNTVYLRASANLLTNKAIFSYSTDNWNFTKLGGELNMPFDLGFFQGDKFGIYNYTTASSGGYVDVNWFHFDTSANEKPNNSTTYEAEKDTTLTNAIVEANHSGYHGEGYVNFNASSGAAIQWNSIYCAVTGTKNVKFRYALEKGTRKLDVYVNETKVVSDASFEATGSWTTWGEKTIQVPMNSGTNTLKVVTTGTEGPNIDNINVSAR